jgi:hypothetical protein
MDMSHATRLHLQNFIILSGIKLVLFLCAFSFFKLATADITTRKIQVSEKDGIYSIHVSQELSVNSHYVRDVLIDVVHVYRLNPSIIESEILSPVEDGVRVRTRLLCCLPMFCREVERVDIISVLTSGEIQARLVPEMSDFDSGKATWKITPLDDDRTNLRYEANIEPGFYIPPVVGVSLVKENLLKEFGTTFDRIERIASINEERDWHHEIHSTQLAIQKSSPEPCEGRLRAGLQ